MEITRNKVSAGGRVLIYTSWVRIDSQQKLLTALAGELLAGRHLAPEGLRDNLLHTVACKAAIKGSRHTDEKEKLALVQEVLSRDDIRYCPHGRPVCIRLTRAQLERQFKRA